MNPKQLITVRRGATDLGTDRELSPAALALVLVAAFVVVLDFSIVNVGLPSIESELGFSPTALQWVVTAYSITFGGLLILGGGAADRFGRRRMFVVGLLVFTVASLAGGLARDPDLLVAARAVQGIGAALVAPAALALVTTGFHEGAARNRALGLYGATVSAVAVAWTLAWPGVTGAIVGARGAAQVDGANAARDFLHSHGVRGEALRIVWDAIALHTTPGIPQHKEPEVALVTAGVELDVLGIGYDDITPEARDAVLTAFPRVEFKERIIQAFADGMAHRPETAFGTVNADVLADKVPGYQRPNFCTIIRSSKHSN